MFDIKDYCPGSHIHFIGIGGISMSGLAQIALKNGFVVTGSDRQKSPITNKLESLGATIFEGHEASNIKGAQLIVHTAAVHDDNPEIAAAKEANIPLITRAVFLGSIMKTFENAVGVAGTHGKTTTTSMLCYALIHANLDPTVSVGGELDIIDGNIKTGSSPYFVTEACEYTNSFLSFFPTIAVITNVDEDHLDFFSGIDEIIESFRKYALLTKDTGCVVAWGEDDNIKKALAGTELDIKYYGISNKNEYYAKNIVYNKGIPTFDIMHKDEFICSVTLSVPGMHNVLNALAVAAVCHTWGLDPELFAKGISKFHGAKRRFEKKGFYNGATIMDDYAHHPTEIKATISAAKDFEYNKLWCVFQPHTYSRTRTLWDEFVNSFYGVDELIIADIYAARELPDGITNAANLAKDIEKKGVKTRYISDLTEIENVLRQEIKPDDLVFTMGAGNVVNIADNLIK